ncbi:regulatory YrvL family protein [Priestia megaterium]|uniref:regulatory YrvL family protein n=1 Tax=Priestia megaterium TaxID=1404 RepID=UPI0021D65344|nr:regulatory YrvL family protein [Priestia megaterium]MCU7741516.1 regulatory YrvL family protein [Priestia megaterium]
MWIFTLKTKKTRSSHNISNFFAKAFTVIFITLIVTITISLMLGAFVFGFVGLFEILGVQYDSFLSLLIFLLLFFIIGFIVDFLSIFLINIFSQQIKSSKRKFLVRLVIDCSFSWFAIHNADELISSISISSITELIAVFLLFLLEVVMDMNSKGESNKSSLVP